MLGIHILVEGTNPVVDIVAVHGLDGDSVESWTDPSSGICWLTDHELLPLEIHNARVLTFGYNVNTMAERTSCATLTEHAISLINGLVHRRRETETQDRPIIFIAHSLGGIIVKEALIHSRLDPGLHTTEFFTSTKAILFFGTPHLGSAWSNVHATVLRLSKIFRHATEHIAKQLADNTGYLTKLQSQFALFREIIHVVYFYEEYGTRTPLGTLLLVSRDSAVPDNQRNTAKLCKDHTGMIKFASSLDDDYKAVISNLKECISNIKPVPPKISIEQQQQLEREKREILAWLNAPVTSSYHHREARNHHRDGTGDWFVESEIFQRWKFRPNSFVWTYGKAGSGKTVLLSTIIEHVMEICRNEAKCGLAYHYCSFQDHPQLLCGDIMASLVDQLQSQISYIPPSLKELQQGRSRDQRASRSADRLMEPLRELISSFTEVYIFIDALDEFDNSHISDLMRLRSSIKKWSNPSLHVLVTSQFHHLSIRESLRVLTNPEDRLDIAADLWNEADIRDHIRSTLAESPQFRRRWSGGKNDVLAEIEAALVEKSNNSFRWVDCQLRALSECRTPKEVRAALSSLPRDLNETYSRILGGLAPSDRALAWRILIWLACATDRLTLGDLAVILSEDEKHHFDVDNELSPVDVVQLCRDLTSLERWGGTPWTPTTSEVISEDYLVLAHSSVRDWLMEPASELKPSIADESWVHAMLATTTLSYVLHTALPHFDDRPSFWHYSVDECLRHASLGPTDRVRQLVLDLFDEQHGIYRVWNKSREYAFVHEDIFNNTDWDTRNPLHHASRCGLSWAIEPLISRGINVNRCGGRFGRPLCAAAYYGHEGICDVLLAAGADIDGVDKYHGTALSAAADGGHVGIVEALLVAGADVNTGGGHYGNALQAAASEGHAHIVEALLAAGVDVNAAGGHYGNALQAAASKGRAQIVQALLAAGADVNAAGGMYGNAVQAATSEGHAQIVQALLAAGGRCDNNALQMAASGGHIQTIKALLVGGADVNAGGDYGSAIQAAASRGNTQIVEILLAAGADVDAAGGPWGGAIQAAAYEGHVEIVSKLLEAGADVNVGGGESTPLYLAIEGNNVWPVDMRTKTAQLLIDAGADVNVLDSKGRSPLFMARQVEGWQDMVDLLTAAGALEIGTTSCSEYGSSEYRFQDEDEDVYDSEDVNSDKDNIQDSSSEVEWHSCAESE